MKNLKEEMITQETLYQGRIVNVRLDQVRLPDGNTAQREVVEHPGAVAILAVDDRNRIALVRQYRYPVGDLTLELPAGKLEPGEEPRQSALRELAEETGLVPDTLIDLGPIYSSPGILAEKVHLFFAKDLHQGQPHPDSEEFVETVWMPFEEAVELARQGEIRDSKTLAGIFKGSFRLVGGPAD